jgi:HAMP domain-containing protein
VTTRELWRWTRLHERRARKFPALLTALIAGAAFAGFVAMQPSPTAASHAWLAAAIVAFALAFMRVPFQLYWRSDASLLAQLPIEGGPLFDVALVRCLRAGALTLVAALIGAIPLALLDAHAIAEATRQISATPIAGEVPHLSPLGFYLHHAAIAGVLALAAGLLIPGVVVWAASLLVEGGGRAAADVAVAVGTGHPHMTPSERANAGAILGAIPGAASAFIIVATIVGSPWLLGDVFDGRAGAALVGIPACALAAAIGARITAPRVFATILRDVSALDRQRLATLEIRPPTTIERAVARLLGDAALPYTKDARLMRRRYPMAFALGALAFIVLVIVGLARASLPWLVAVAAGGVLYAGALAGRLARPPIELPRLSATLPIAPAARRRAKLAWLVTWSLVYLVVPLVFAVLRVV